MRPLSLAVLLFGVALQRRGGLSSRRAEVSLEPPLWRRGLGLESSSSRRRKLTGHQLGRCASLYREEQEGLKCGKHAVNAVLKNLGKEPADESELDSTAEMVGSPSSGDDYDLAALFVTLMGKLGDDALSTVGELEAPAKPISLLLQDVGEIEDVDVLPPEQREALLRRRHTTSLADLRWVICNVAGHWKTFFQTAANTTWCDLDSIAARQGRQPRQLTAAELGDEKCRALIVPGPPEAAAPAQEAPRLQGAEEATETARAAAAEAARLQDAARYRAEVDAARLQAEEERFQAEVDMQAEEALEEQRREEIERVREEEESVQAEAEAERVQAEAEAEHAEEVAEEKTEAEAQETQEEIPDEPVSGYVGHTLIAKLSSNEALRIKHEDEIRARLAEEGAREQEALKTAEKEAVHAYVSRILISNAIAKGSPQGDDEEQLRTRLAEEKSRQQEALEKAEQEAVRAYVRRVLIKQEAARLEHESSIRAKLADGTRTDLETDAAKDIAEREAVRVYVAQLLAAKEAARMRYEAGILAKMTDDIPLDDDAWAEMARLKHEADIRERLAEAADEVSNDLNELEAGAVQKVPGGRVRVSLTRIVSLAEEAQSELRQETSESLTKALDVDAGEVAAARQAAEEALGEWRARREEIEEVLGGGETEERLDDIEDEHDTGEDSVFDATFTNDAVGHHMLATYYERRSRWQHQMLGEQRWQSVIA